MKIEIDEVKAKKSMKKAWSCKFPHCFLSPEKVDKFGPTEIEREFKNKPLVTIDELVDIVFESDILKDHLEKCVDDYLNWKPHEWKSQFYFDNDDINEMFEKAAPFLPNFEERKAKLEAYIDNKKKEHEEKKSVKAAKYTRMLENLGYNVKIGKK